MTVARGTVSPKLEHQKYLNNSPITTFVKQEVKIVNKTTPHYAHPTGFALGLTAGIIYSVCTLLVAFWPAQTIKTFNYWFHGIDLSQIYALPSITIGTYLIGLIEVVLFFYVTGLLYGFLYNKCVGHCKKRGWI